MTITTQQIADENICIDAMIETSEEMAAYLESQKQYSSAAQWHARVVNLQLARQCVPFNGGNDAS